MKQPHDDFSEIRRLLALKRNEFPSADYFNGILSEFHRRQRLAPAAAPSFSWTAAWAAFWARLGASLASPRLVGVASLACVAWVALIGMTINAPTVAPAGSTSPMLALEVVPQEAFAFDQALLPTGQADLGTEAAPAEFQISLDDTSLPHYVLAETSARYDAALAF